MSPITELIGGAKAYGWSSFSVPGSFESIAATTLGAGGAATITFSSIPQTYTHLQIRCLVRTVGPTNGENTYVYFNNTPNSTNYATHGFRTNGASLFTVGGINDRMLANVATPNAANIFGGLIINIFDYTNTNKYKTIQTIYGWDSNGAGNVGQHSTLVPQSAATTQIDIDLAYNFAQYSSFALYGIKAA